MPNWCSNSMVVYGSPTEIKDFYSKVKLAIQRGNENKHWHLYEIYAVFGYEENEVLSSSDNGYIRGSIDDVTEIVNNDDESYFTVYYESAWSSMCEGFDWLLEHNYKTLKQVTLAEECGCEYYINTDKEHKFFQERYILDVVDYDIYYCSTIGEVFQELQKYLDTKKHFKSMSLRELERVLDQNDNELEGYQIYFHEYCNY